MAREKNAWERMREKQEAREEEERRGLTQETHLKMPSGAPGNVKIGQTGDPLVIELMNRAEIMIEQIQNLHNMYVAGLERLPPITQRKQLDDVVAKIMAAQKPTPALLFRVNQFNAKYTMYREK